MTTMLGNKPVFPEAECDRAFNEGCQARIEGRPTSDCPYDGSIGHPQRALFLRWQIGWRDVNQNWGRDARWPVKELSTV